MTITFKPGYHPDADQLSAFIEQALPAHERDGVLAHLAVCSECRAVVALALPEVPSPRPAIEPRSWFTGWMVFLPAAAAVVALTAFIFFVHHQGPALLQQAQVSPATTSVAPEHPQTAPQAQLESRRAAEPAAASPALRGEIAAAANQPASGQKEKAENASSGSAGVIQAAPSQPAANESAVGQNVVTQNQSVQSAPAQNAVNSFAPAANNAVVSQNQSSDQASAPRSAFHGGAISGAIQSNNSLQQNEANTQNEQQQNRQMGSATQTVQVQAEAQPAVATESAELSAVIAGRATSSLTFSQQPLPSHLAVLSSAAQGPVVLAIDTHHSVFVSNDSGQHWKTVRAAWKGHAVMVEASVPVKMLALPVTGANVETYSAIPQGAMAAKKTGAFLTGTVTDASGAVIPGATVTVTDPQTGLARTLTTDARGHYVAAGLDPGNYDLDATAQGFMSNHLSKVAVTDSKENLANFTLRVGAATETVTVEASGALDELKTAQKLKAAPTDKKARPAPTPLFEIVTDKGVHWSSADGISWQPR
jgi:Carboxypeptidase regulatory-like domain/Putative zinc-finger